MNFYNLYQALPVTNWKHILEKYTVMYECINETEDRFWIIHKNELNFMYEWHLHMIVCATHNC